MENPIKCGTCSAVFDLPKNRLGCPVCNIQAELRKAETQREFVDLDRLDHTASLEYIAPPPSGRYPVGKVYANDETRVWGAGLLFNDFFSSKLILRIIGWHLHDSDDEWIDVETVMMSYIFLIKRYQLHRTKGFPKKVDHPESLKKNPSITRAVRTVMKTLARMALLRVKDAEDDFDRAWKGSWSALMVSMTSQGHEFAVLENSLLSAKHRDPDFNKKVPRLSIEESEFMNNHLASIESDGFREHSWHENVFKFIEERKTSGTPPINSDIMCFFLRDELFFDHVVGPGIFDDGIYGNVLSDFQTLKERTENAYAGSVKGKIWNSVNTARSISTAKISLMRQLGYIGTEWGEY